jgi:putative intracellular protease/amidase
VKLIYPVYRLREEDVSVTVAGLNDQPVTGKKGHGPLQIQATIEKASEEDYAALVMPGGFTPNRLRRSQQMLDLVKAAGRVTSASTAAIWDQCRIGAGSNLQTWTQLRCVRGRRAATSPA